MEFIIDIFIDALMDSIKLLPFLFITYLIMEYVEHKTNKKTENLIKKSGKFGPLLGGILGIFPQCGFSAAAANLYANRLVSLGTIIAIFLSTSDEMLPIFISESVEISIILKILAIKLVVAIIFGFLVDFVLNKFLKKQQIHHHSDNDDFNNTEISHMCEKEHCGCENGILVSSIKHTLNIFVYIFIVTLLLNGVFELIGKDNISNLITSVPFLGPIIAGFIGLIPNCASSVVITQLYLSGSINVSTLLSGLLVGSGVGILVLFRSNKNIKENAKITILLYLIGVFVGIFFELIGLKI